MNFRVKARLDCTLIVEVEPEEGVSEEESKEDLTDHVKELLFPTPFLLYDLESVSLNLLILEEETQIHVEVERGDD